MRCRLLLAVFVALAAPAPSLAEPVVIKLGTLAPDGSVWHDALLQVRQLWRDITDGELELRIYPGVSHAFPRDPIKELHDALEFVLER